MKYKIGEVSKILNIPIDTLRYLETMDIVGPQKDDVTNYRSYDAWDINFLTEYKKYRGYDFSVSEVREILHKDDTEHYIHRIEEKQKDFVRKHIFYSAVIKKNQEYLDILKNLKGQLWQCYFKQMPEMYYFMHRYNYKYDRKDKFEGIFEKWLDYFPLVDTILEIPYESVMNREQYNDYKWGFAVRKSYVELLNIPLNEKVLFNERKECVYTIITAGEKGTFKLKLLDDAVAYIEKNGYVVSGNVLGNLLARTHEENGYTRYIELWIPVAK